MTREQAIQEALDDAILYHESQAKSIQEAIGKTNHPRAVELYEDAKRYNETALTALREALKRRQGCDFCNESERIQNQYGDIMEMDDGALILDTEGYPRVTFRIKYCPMCGRKLEDEK